MKDYVTNLTNSNKKAELLIKQMKSLVDEAKAKIGAKNWKFN